MHDRSSDDQVFGELVLQVRPEKALSLHGEGTLVLQFDIDIRTALEDRSVQDRHSSHRIVHGVVDVLDERRTAGRYGHTSARDIHRAQTDLTAVRTFVFTGQVEFILLA